MQARRFFFFFWYVCVCFAIILNIGPSLLANERGSRWDQLHP